MTIDILICTYNDKILQACDVILPFREGIFYKISHQLTDERYSYLPSVLNRKDITVNQIYSKGLSENRNNVLNMATADLCFVADDDVRYTFEEIENVLHVFEDQNDLDVFVGKIRTYEGEGEYKNYSSKTHRISWLEIGKVSSIEMVIRKDAIRKNAIYFDDRFGLAGKLYPKGEEVIFLSDCMKRKLNVVFFPLYIVKHPYLSSGKNFSFDAYEVEYWGALTKRIFKRLWWIVMLILLLKHYKYYRKQLTMSRYIKNFYIGTQKITYK